MIRRPRNNFSSETKRSAHERSKGICECHMIPHVFEVFCGLPLGPGNTFYEHVNPDKISGRNDLDNAAVLSRTCWKHKTTTYDLPTIAKVKRNEDRARGIKPFQSRPMVGTFASDIHKPLRFGARPVRRSTGQEM